MRLTIRAPRRKSPAPESANNSPAATSTAYDLPPISRVDCPLSRPRQGQRPARFDISATKAPATTWFTCRTSAKPTTRCPASESRHGPDERFHLRSRRRNSSRKNRPRPLRRWAASWPSRRNSTSMLSSARTNTPPGDEHCPDVPQHPLHVPAGREVLPGVGGLEKILQGTPEGRDLPHLTATEDYVDTPAQRKVGAIIDISWELVG